MQKLTKFLNIFLMVVGISGGVLAQPLDMVLDFEAFSMDGPTRIECMDTDGVTTVFGKTIEIPELEVWLWALYTIDPEGVEQICYEIVDDINMLSIKSVSIFGDVVVIVYYQEHQTMGGQLKVKNIALDGTGVGLNYSYSSVDETSVSTIKTDEAVFVEFLQGDYQVVVRRDTDASSQSTMCPYNVIVKELSTWNGNLIAIGSDIIQQSGVVLLFDSNIQLLETKTIKEQTEQSTLMQGFVIGDVLYCSYGEFDNDFIVHTSAYDLASDVNYWDEENQVTLPEPEEGYQLYYYKNPNHTEGCIYVSCVDELVIYNEHTGYSVNIGSTMVIDPILGCDLYDSKLFTWRGRIFHAARNWDPVGEKSIVSLTELQRNQSGVIDAVHWASQENSNYVEVGVIANEFLYIFGSFEDEVETLGFIRIFDTTPTYTTIFNVLDTDTWIPIEGASVEIDGYEVITDMNGQAFFELAYSLNGYWAIITANGYETEDVTFTVEGGNPIIQDVYLGQIVDIDEIAETVISIYPNPVNDWLNIQTDVQINSLIISDVTGTIVKSINNIDKIDVSDFTAGIYFITISVENRKYQTKIIKD